MSAVAQCDKMLLLPFEFSNRERQHTSEINWKRQFQLLQQFQISMMKQQEGFVCRTSEFVVKLTNIIDNYSSYKKLKKQEKYTESHYEIYHQLRKTMIVMLKQNSVQWKSSKICEGCKHAYGLWQLDRFIQTFNNISEDKYPGRSGPLRLFKTVTDYIQDINQFQIMDLCVDKK